MIRRAAQVFSPYALLGVLMTLVLVPLLGVSPAYAAKTITISLTADGPKPANVTAAIGDTIQFKNDDSTFVHDVGNKSTNWPTANGSFDSGPLPPGATYPVGKLTKAGTYLYEGKNLDSFSGQVVVPSATGPVPTKSPTAKPAASRTPAPQQSTTASPSPTGGTGNIGPPPLAGGIIPPPSPLGGGSVPAPNVAPTLAGEELPTVEPSGPVVAIGHGRLPEPPTGRKYGLPAALAAVGAVGVASLLVRLLLAHPAARRAKHAAGRGDIPVTID
jgi:plastocyanin